MSMPAFNRAVAFTVFSLISLMSFNVSASMSGLPDFTRLVEEYSDAVVNISTTQKIKKRSGIQHQIPGIPNEGPFVYLFRKLF